MATEQDLFSIPEIESEIDDESVFDLDVSEFEGFNDDHDSEFDFSFDTDNERYINPGKKKVTSKPVKYRNAMQLAREIGDIGPEDRYFVFLDGGFVFGDFIEAWVMDNCWNVKSMTISTLSLSQNNVDSLGNLFYGDYLQELNIIVSDYWWSHERDGLVKYMYHELDKENRFQLAVARVHTKICLITTECGKNIIIHGSANLRTSHNVEQIIIECDKDLFDFNMKWHNEILEKFKTIKKSVTGVELWQADPEYGKPLTKIDTEKGRQARLRLRDGQGSGKGLTESKTDVKQGERAGTSHSKQHKGRAAW